MKILSGSAALALLALTGCDSAAPPSTDAAPAPAQTSSAPAAACRMPIAFDLLPGWEANPIDVSRLTDLQKSFMRGGVFDAVCSVDGKPAGTPGFVRVYATDVSSGNRRDDLKAFVSAFTVRNGEALNYEVRDPSYTDVTIGGRPAAEAEWTRYDKDKKTGRDYTAFTVDTPSGPVVVLKVPYTPAEKANVEPAYELAKKTLTVA